MWIFRYFYENLIAEQNRWFLFVPVILGIGISLYFALMPSSFPLVIGSSTAIIVACGVLSWLLRSSIWRLVPICIGIIAFGISISALRMEEIAAPILDENYSSKEVLGVVEWVTPTRNSFRIDLRILSIEGFKKEEVPKRIQLYWNTEEAHSLIPGCQIYAKMRLFALEESKVQGGYDARFWRQFSGIGGRGSMKELLYADCSKKLSWKEKINHIRIHLTDKLSGKTRASNILPALVTGVRYKIDPQAHQALRDSGLAHILAISGLHMAFFAIMIFQGLVTFLSVSSYHIQKFPLRAICSVIAIGCAFAYLLISGSGIATQRAFLMVSIGFLAIIMERPVLSMRNAAIAALAILLWRPESFLQVGFQMSFAAVISLLAVYEARQRRRVDKIKPGRRRKKRKTRFQRIMFYFYILALTSIIAGSATGLFAAWHFHRFVIYGLFANLLTLPILAFVVMPAILLSILLLPFGLEGLVIPIANIGLSWILFIAEQIASLPHAVQSVAVGGMASLVIMATGLVWLCLWGRRWRYIGILPLLIGIWMMSSAPKPVLLFSPKLQMIAARDKEGELGFSKIEERDFLLIQWLRREGKSGELEGIKKISCITASCTISFWAEGEAHIFVRVKRRAQWQKACKEASLIVSFLKIPEKCEAPHILPARLFEKGGEIFWKEGAPYWRKQ